MRFSVSLYDTVEDVDVVLVYEREELEESEIDSGGPPLSEAMGDPIKTSTPSVTVEDLSSKCLQLHSLQRAFVSR
jgi:hypothetical protein